MRPISEPTTTWATSKTPGAFMLVTTVLVMSLSSHTRTYLSTTISIFIRAHSTDTDILRTTEAIVDGSQVPTAAKLTGAQGPLVTELAEGVSGNVAPQSEGNLGGDDLTPGVQPFGRVVLDRPLACRVEDGGR